MAHPENPMPRLRKEGRGIFIDYRDRTLYRGETSRRHGQGQMEQLFRQGKAGESLILCPSPLHGEVLADWIDQLPADTHILAVEADPALSRFSRDQMPAGLLENPRFTLLPLEDPPGPALTAWLGSRGSFLPWRRIHRISLTGGGRLSPRLYREAENILREELQTHWRNRLTQIHLGRLWISNLIENISHLPRHRPLPAASEITPGCPAAVLGAGESLEQDLPLLRRFREQGGYLLAVDTALPLLAEANLYPDGVIALEAQQINQEDFMIPAPPSRLRLFADITSYSALNRLGPGPGRWDYTFFITPFTDIPLLHRLRKAFPQLPQLPAAGSVGLSALSLALKLTDGPVFYTGLDFAYRHGKTHSRDTAFMKQDLRRSNRLHPPGNRLIDLTMARYRTVLPPPADAFKEGTARADETSRLLTDPSLQLYARLMNRMTEGEPRLRRLEENNLPDWRPETISDGKENPVIEYGVSGVKPFLHGEAEALTQLQEALQACYRRAGGDLSLDEPSRQLLHRADYLFCFFPDAHRGLANPLPRDFANRLIPVIRHFRRAWQRAAEKL